MRRIAALAAIALIPLASPAHAEVPPAVRAMIDAAVASGDAAKVRTVIDLAKATLPDDQTELEALFIAFEDSRRAAAPPAPVPALVLPASASPVKVAAAPAQQEHHGLLHNWAAKGQLGAFQSSGNSKNTGVSLSLVLDRKGKDWQHQLRGNIDYQRSNGLTSTERYLAAYEPRYQVSGKLFAYGLAQYEQNRFLGYRDRYSLSGGFGLKVLEAPEAQLSVKAGPSWRKVEYTNGQEEQSFGALAGFDFDWRFAKNLTFTQDANLVADSGGAATVIIDSNSTSVLLVSGLEAKVNSNLTTRLSYTLDYDSNPPRGRVSTDTLTRMTLVFGF